MFGRIEPAQAERLRPIIAGRTVWTLGSGPDLHEAWQLISMGATTVHAVDKASRHITPTFTPVDPPGIVDCRAYFHEFEAHHTGTTPPDVAVVKWPQTNRQDGLTRLIARAHTVVYIGRNDGATACGPPDMWRHLRTRTLVDVVEGHRNDMLVYGPPHPTGTTHPPRCREERHAYTDPVPESTPKNPDPDQ